MCIFDAITNINWFEFIKWFVATVPPIITAWIAWSALQNWKKPAKAKRESEFINELHNRLCTFTTEINPLIEFLKEAKGDIEKQKSKQKNTKKADIKAATTYIDTYGKKNAEYRIPILQTTKLSLTSIESLIEQGKIFTFDNYEKIQNSVKTFREELDRVERFINFIRISPITTWDDPFEKIILKNLVIDPNPEDISEKIRENKEAAMEFTSKLYNQLYK